MSADTNVIPASQTAGLSVPVQANAAQAPRLAEIDALKGAGIVLVVLGHALGGMLAARLLDEDGWGAATFYAIYLFHMPLFFMLSGLFVQARLQRSWRGFVTALGPRVIWPYFLWSAVQLAVIQFAGNSVNTPAPLTLARLIELAWQPASQYWFLYLLFFFHLVTALFQRAGAVPLLLPLAIGAGALQSWLGLDWPSRHFFFPFLCYYALGVWLTECRLQRLMALASTLRTRRATTLALLLLFAAVATALYGAHVTYYSAAAIGGQVLGVICAIALPALTPAPVIRFSAWLGRRSMAIFLLHVMAVAGCRIILSRVVGITDARVLLAITIVAGIVLPCIALGVARRAGASRVLALE